MSLMLGEMILSEGPSPTRTLPVFFLMGLLYVLMGGEDHDTPAPTGRDEGVRRRSDDVMLVGSDLSSTPEGGEGNVTPENDDSTAAASDISFSSDVASTEVGSGERNEKPLDKLVDLTSSTVVGEERKANADIVVVGTASAPGCGAEEGPPPPFRNENDEGPVGAAASPSALRDSSLAPFTSNPPNMFAWSECECRSERELRVIVMVVVVVEGGGGRRRLLFGSLKFYVWFNLTVGHVGWDDKDTWAKKRPQFSLHSSVAYFQRFISLRRKHFVVLYNLSPGFKPFHETSTGDFGTGIRIWSKQFAKVVVHIKT